MSETAFSKGGFEAFNEADSTQFQFEHCAFDQTTWGTGATAGPVELTGAECGFLPSQGSAAIDAGTPGGADPDGSPLDLGWRFRPTTPLPTLPDYVPTDGLLAYWPLDGNGLDQSGSGHHLTETNIQSGHDRHGANESAVVFNGEDSHLTLDAFNLNQTGAFSVGFWAQMDPSAFTEPQCLFYEGVNGEFHFANADPGVDFTQFHWAAKANSSAWYGPAAGPLNSGEWNHFVGTYDQGMLELFVNGVSVATQQAACCSQAPTDQLVLGARRVTSFVEHPFSGALDEFALWNRVLSTSEIADLHSGETVSSLPDHIPTDGLIGWYPLDGDAAESTGIQEDGMLINVEGIPDRHGVINGALEIQGNGSYVHLGLEDEARLASSDELTLSMWIHPTANGAPLTKYRNGSGAASSWFLQYADGFGYRFWGNGTSGTPTDADWPSLCPNSSSGWNHIVVVYNGGTGDLWMDGNLVCSSSFPVSSQTNQNFPVLIGRSHCVNGSSCNSFTGQVDELGLWNRALTPAEITSLYQAEPPTLGCTDASACNYDAEANVDDGSCYSCDVPAAHCGPGTHWDATLSACVADTPSAEVAEDCTLMSLQELTEGYLTPARHCELPGQPACRPARRESGQWRRNDRQLDLRCPAPLPRLRLRHRPNRRPMLVRGKLPIPPRTASPSDESNVEPRFYILNQSHTDLEVGTQSEEYTEYGVLYNLPAALMEGGTCPSGWHLPTLSEWDALGAFAESAGANSLKGESWGGTNLLGFNAKPAGHRSDTGEFIREGTESDLWSSTNDPGCINGVARLYSNEDHLITDQWMLHCESGNSVRCVKD